MKEIKMVKYIPQKWIEKLLEYASDDEKECYHKVRLNSESNNEREKKNENK